MIIEILDGFFLIILVGVGVDLRAGYAVVTEQLLDGPHVGNSQKPAGKSMSEHVRIDTTAEGL